MNNTDLTFFTNTESLKLEDRFRSTFRYAKYFDILVGYFRSSGFHLLYKDMENIDKVRILVGLNADKKTVDLVNAGTQINLDLESQTKTKEILSENFSTEIYAADDSPNVEFGIRKFIEFIRSKKIEFRAYPSTKIHAKVYINRFPEDFPFYGTVITGSSNFSESGLNSQYEFNVELKNRADVDYALNKFEELWKDGVDLSELYIDTVNKKTWLNDEITPYEIYLKFLYENLSKKLETNTDLEITRPDGFMKLDYQEQAVLTLRDIVDTYGGAFVSDVVGLGKTYIAAMYAQGLPGKKLFICPPPIKESWENAINDFGVRSATIESLGKLHHIKRKGYEKYDYVFVDEAHRFRSENTEQYKLLNEICYGKKVILISATPLNNSVYDFLPLLKLFQLSKQSDIPNMPNLEAFFVNARNTLKNIESGTDEYLDAVKRISKEVRDKVLKYVMIRRTRTDVKEFYRHDIKNQDLFFPEVEAPKRIFYKFDETTCVIFDKTIEYIKCLKYARYQPTFYLNESISKALGIDEFEKTQERNLVGFMKTRLIKRLESSKFAFSQTIDRFIASHEKFIKMYDKGTIYISAKVDVYDYLNDENEDALIAALEKDDLHKIYNKDDFQARFREDLQKDLDALRKIRDMWAGIPKDFKKEEFKKQLLSDKNLSENKIIVFTESTETGVDLYDSLVDTYGKGVVFYSSGVCRYENVCISNPIAKDLIHQNYDPKCNNQSDDIKILITTDVLAEGINLHKSNLIINYDLPWNPTRVLQRVGRVNRVGTKHKNILIYNIFPTVEAESQLNLGSYIKAKIQAFHETLGEDAKYLSEDEVVTNHRLFGEKLYDVMNDKKTFSEDDVLENLELKYLNILKDIQKNDVELFDKIKKLPKKARTGKQFAIDKKSLLTFFRQGNFLKTFISDGNNSTSLVFDDAVKLFECEKDCKRLPVESAYHEFLQNNKNAFMDSKDEEYTVVAKSKGGASNEREVISRIEFAIKTKQLTTEQEEYLQKILELYKIGAIVKDISKTIKSEISKIKSSQDVYASVVKNVPKTYIESERSIGKSKSTDVSEIILSEFLIP